VASAAKAAAAAAAVATHHRNRMQLCKITKKKALKRISGFHVFNKKSMKKSTAAGSLNSEKKSSMTKQRAYIYI